VIETLWKKKDKPYQNIETLISSAVEIRGEINSQGSIKIDGTVEGNVIIKGDLVVGEKGKIKGEVKVENVILAGTIEGNVSARGRVEITATGTMVGDIVCKIITVEEGGVLNGTSKMPKGKEEKTKSDNGK